jgi:hypothetical protein
MADRLYLSYWIRGFNAISMAHHYERVLRAFPFSKLRRGDSHFRVYAVSFQEPTLLEMPVPPPVEAGSLLAATANLQNPDVCYELDTAWDLWVWDREWKLGPSEVILSCLGPEFENESGESILIDFGLDEQFLPGSAREEGLPMVKANIQSLLRLVHELDDKLNAERRLLWSESGENFAEKLELTLRSLA